LQWTFIGEKGLKTVCRRVETVTSMFVQVGVRARWIWWLGWTQEHKKLGGDVRVYLGLGQVSPYVQQLMILVLKSPQNLEGYNRV
jgi:hypothetical protein